MGIIIIFNNIMSSSKKIYCYNKTNNYSNNSNNHTNTLENDIIDIIKNNDIDEFSIMNNIEDDFENLRVSEDNINQIYNDLNTIFNQNKNNKCTDCEPKIKNLENNLRSC